MRWVESQKVALGNMAYEMNNMIFLIVIYIYHHMTNRVPVKGLDTLQSGYFEVYKIYLILFTT